MKGRLAVFFGALAIVSYGLYSVVLVHYLHPTKYAFPTKGYYGSGKEHADDTSIVPFKVDVPTTAIQDLKNRLKTSRIGHKQLEDADNFEYGFNLGTLKQFQDYWLNKFDWKKQESVINQFPQFTTEIEGLKIHFLHVKPPQAQKYKRVVPLLIVHGWPGNVFEFYKIIPLLTDPKKHLQGGSGQMDWAFEVVMPSIPGYGWSEQPHKTGFDQLATARVFNKLMVERLKHNRYIAQGGDWGAFVCSNIARMYPERLFGLHLNAMIPFPRGPVAALHAFAGSIAPRLIYSSPRFVNFSWTKLIGDFMKEGGYFHLQATKPDTVGIGLNDSPIGLMAYILEKYSTWTNPRFRSAPDGGLARKFTKDELLTMVSIYWFNGNIVSSQRYYKESFGEAMALGKEYVKVPTGFAAFPNDILESAPVELARYMYNITHYTEFNDGGHFVAFEMPTELADDIFRFTKTVVI